MSYEYNASHDAISSDIRAAVEAILEQIPDVAIAVQTDTAIHLIYPIRPERPGAWPEDIALHFSDGGLSAVIHSATSHERQRFLSALEAGLGERGHRLSFEAL